MIYVNVVKLSTAMGIWWR